MYVIIWRYTVNPDAVAEFDRHYNASGSWVNLFRTAPGYIKTELFRDSSDPYVFLTLDYWQSEAAFMAFNAGAHPGYQALDKTCEALTAREERLGVFGS